MHRKRTHPLDTGHAHVVAGPGRHAAAGGQGCRGAGNRGEEDSLSPTTLHLPEILLTVLGSGSEPQIPAP